MSEIDHSVAAHNARKAGTMYERDFSYFLLMEKMLNTQYSLMTETTNFCEIIQLGQEISAFYDDEFLWHYVCKWINNRGGS